jgi:uncharacterized protein (DUF39 family)
MQFDKQQQASMVQANNCFRIFTVAVNHLNNITLHFR